MATILATYAQRHGGPSQLAAERLVALLTNPSHVTSGTPVFFFAFQLNHVYSLPSILDGGFPTLVSAELQSGSQGEGTPLEMSLHFQYPLLMGVAITCAQVKQWVHRGKLQRFTAQELFFFSCLTFANSLARNLLEGSTIPLEDDISGSQPVLLSVTRGN